MYVISLAGWRRRWGPWLQTLLITLAVLLVLFQAYRWLIGGTQAGGGHQAPPAPRVAWSPQEAGFGMVPSKE